MESRLTRGFEKAPQQKQKPMRLKGGPVLPHKSSRTRVQRQLRR